MADARVIRFPSERRSQRDGPHGTSAATAGDPHVALSVDVRELPTMGQALSARTTLAARIRCAAAAAEVLSGFAPEVRIAGTARHPVIEARVTGDGAAEGAAQAALAAARAVWSEQHAGPCRLALAGGLAMGRHVQNRGMRIESASATTRADRLRERAAPGQILVGGEGCERLAAHLIGQATMAQPRFEGTPTRALRSVR